MSATLPQGEKSRQAVKWISSQLEDGPEQKIGKLVEEAISRFDMNPMEAEMLMQFYRNK